MTFGYLDRARTEGIPARDIERQGKGDGADSLTAYGERRQEMLEKHHDDESGSIDKVMKRAMQSQEHTARPVVMFKSWKRSNGEVAAVSAGPG